MTRRKSVCSKWTLVLLVVVSCQFVHSRPQEVSPVSTPPTNNVQTTETTQRYRYRNNEQLARFKSPIVISYVNSSFSHNKIPASKKETNFKLNSTNRLTESPFYYYDSNNYTNSRLSRKSRLILNKNISNEPRKKHGSISSVKKNTKNRVKIADYKNNLKVSEPMPMSQKKPPIRKIITKWRDKAKYEDLDFNSETTMSNEIATPYANSYATDGTESNNDISTEAAQKGNKYQNLNKLYNKLLNNRYKPQPEYSEETQVYSSNVHIIDKYPFQSSRPTYVFTTPMPTPIITNVGNPQPWHQHQPSFQNVYRKTTKKPPQTKRPIKNQYDYQNSVHNNLQYPYHNFEVTTFPPSNAYTDRIVIRPEEYAASPDECPTIFLTLNNTFQGQGKEACPDLNIAVNTNVVNKNVVIESDEEETESLFPDAFGEPLDDSEAESTQANDYFESEEDEEQGDSASVEGTELSNYNAANEEILSDSPEAGGFGSPSTNLAALHKPSSGSDLDDLFTFSGFFDFFRPSLSALSWLVSLNPFNFGLLSFFFSPIAMLFASAYGIATFFSRLPFAREAPKVIHVFQPQWQWDDEIKAWHLNSFPVDREYKYRIPKNSKEEKSAIKPTLFFKLKEWMKSTTKELREANDKRMVQNNRRSKHKKREAWTRRVK